MSKPPSAGPSAGAAKNTMPKLAGMFRLVSLSLISRPMASGTIGAATSPCTTRAAISTPTEGASAQPAEASVNPASTAV